MLLGSAALGALRVGDAPYPFLPFIPPPPPPPSTGRIPSGHNIFVAPSSTAPFQDTTYLVYTFAGGELDELGAWFASAQYGGAQSSIGTFTVVRNVSPIGQPVPSLVFGVLPEVPPQENEPGVTLYFSLGNQIPVGTPVTLTLMKPSGAFYTVASSLVYIGTLAIPAGAANPIWRGAPPSPQPVVTGNYAFIYSPVTHYELPGNAAIDQTITVVDASGTAGVAPITVSAASAMINNQSIFIINQSGGATTFVWSGTQWLIISGLLGGV